MNEGLLSVKNASGRHVSLLNSNDEPNPPIEESKRKYHCTEPGCHKSFTTSGHLARHNRIHTGEKNFPCLFPGCQSRFSRQDNMMQHYRTHMSPKSRRSQKRGVAEEARPRPRLHAHHRIRSDPVRVEPPLTIDQHLSNYHQSLSIPPPVRFNHFPLPLSSTARTPSSVRQTVRDMPALPSIHQLMDDHTTQKKPNLFYQHRPLTFTRPENTHFPYTLLHPAQQQEEDKEEKEKNSGLLQLAHIVSTFG
ncbi:hypothetical protein EDC96DRAFT_549207 [Choanephora cucurbitarum]|nr:hypothetical protein EDC96DRAFT_549207 [Choanephora cucurbitarum]